jgi:AraC-like DNA-binding protein
MNFTLLTYGPLMLMYARKNKAELETASTRWWLLAPVAIWAIPYFIILGLWLAGSFFDVTYLQIYNRSIVVVMVPLNVACFLGAIRISRTYPAEQIAIKNLIRIISVTGIASVVFCLALVIYVVANDIPFGPFQEVVRSIGSVALLSICLIIARYALIGDRPRVLAFPSSPAKPRPPQMTRERQKEIHDKLVDKVTQDRLYLDPDFNMEKLTAATGYSRHQISEVLNQYADISFYPFVNRFRVEQVCAQMKKAAAKDNMSSLNMLELSYACGFKSKSSFNEYFRRFTGETPSQYWANLPLKEKKV